MKIHPFFSKLCDLAAGLFRTTPDEVNISGGKLVNARDAGGVLYKGDDGASCLFKGVSLSLGRVVDRSAYQWNGTIHVSPGWIASGFTVNDFAHEYGHFLQQNQSGVIGYCRIALSSMYSLATNPRNHSSRSFEREATELGRAYLKENMSQG